MKTKESEFLKELEFFCTEVESAIQFCYAFLTLHASLFKNQQAHDVVNRTPLFWNTNLAALQSSFFITLGRIFDQQSEHNVDKVIKSAQRNSVIFSKEALEARKREGSPNADEWIHDYMKDVYVPTPDDFRRLRRCIKQYRSIYEKAYRDIRHKVFAHNGCTDRNEVSALFARTDVLEMQKLIVFTNRLYTALWQLYYNGRKPVLKPMKYSVKSMLKQELPKWQSKHTQERIVHDVREFVKLLATIG